jgi:predicted Zn-dependent protease
MIRLKILLLFVGAGSSFAYSQTEDVILKAMQDELDRNQKELTLKNMERPFFIMYGLADSKSLQVSASMGALTSSSEDRDRIKTTTRVMVGDYEFNDESLDDNQNSGNSSINIDLPVDDDYWGIRRSFWASTDNVYRSAARIFEKNKKTLKETGKPLSEVPHRRFAKVPPARIIQNLIPATYSRTEWEQRIRKLSGVLTSVLNINNSFVFVNYTEGHQYLVNTEGLVTKIPFSNASLAIAVQVKNQEGKFFVEQKVYQTKTLDQLPTETQLMADMEQIIRQLEASQKIKELEEEYNGPVLLEGKTVAEAFSNSILRGREGIFANDNIAKLKGFQFDEESLSAEGKIGKNVINPQITIKAKPKLTHYQGVELTGNYQIDNEGVIPPGELAIIENGVLKNLLNNRTLTSSTQTANGFSDGPGVLEITIAQKDTDKSLKDKLIQQAKKEGLSFGLIFRESASRMGFVTAIKVYVEDGREEPVRYVSLREYGFKMWKRILGASEKYTAHNLDELLGDRGSRQVSISMIVPHAILLEEAEVQPFRTPSLKEEEYISRPLK